MIFLFGCRLIGHIGLPEGTNAVLSICLPATKVTSLNIIQRSAKYKCTWTYFPMRWCNLMVTSRAFSITVSGIYEKCTGSPLKCCPPMLKNTFACVNTCKKKWWQQTNGKKRMKCQFDIEMEWQKRIQCIFDWPLIQSKWNIRMERDERVMATHIVNWRWNWISLARRCHVLVISRCNSIKLQAHSSSDNASFSSVAVK